MRKALALTMLKRMLALLLAVSSLCVGTLNAYPQPVPRPKQYAEASGLPSSLTSDVVEDRQGYIWISTIAGLVRFDGIDFTEWKLPGISGSRFIWALAVDRNDNLWAGTDKGELIVYDRTRRTDRAWRPEKESDLLGVPISYIKEGSFGQMWIATAGRGIYRVDSDRRITAYKTENRGINSDTVWSVAIDSDGRVWAATIEGIAVFDGKKFSVVPGSGKAVEYSQLVSLPNGDMWASTKNGVETYRKHGEKWERLPSPDESSFSQQRLLLIDSGKARWYAGSSGLYRISENGEKSKVITYSISMEANVSPLFRSGFQAADGSIWLSSENMGVWYVPSNWDRFTIFRGNEADSKFSTTSIWATAEARGGGIFFSGDGGFLDYLDADTGLFTTISKKISGGKQVVSLNQADDNHVWASFEQGVSRLDLASGELNEWTPSSGRDSSFSNFVAGLNQDAAGRIWMFEALLDRVQARNRSGSVEISSNVENVKDGNKKAMIMDMATSPSGKIWIITNNSVFAWNAAKGNFTKVEGISTKEPRSILFDGSDDVLWISDSGSLYRFDRMDGGGYKIIDAIGAREGYPGHKVKISAIDRFGNLWGGSSKGIVRVDAKARNVQIYDTHDGLRFSAVSESPLLLSDGKIAAANMSDLVLIDPEKFLKPSFQSRLVIDSVSVERAGNIVNFDPHSRFDLLPGDRSLRVRARLLAYDDPARNHYRSRLIGFDDNWVEVVGGADRVFSQIAPGDYTMLISARTHEGAWVPEKRLLFTVAPPWWLTWWAYLGYVIFILVLLWLASWSYRLRLRRANEHRLALRERELATEASQAKSRFLATLGHEIRTPMTGVLGMSELMLAGRLEPEQRGRAGAIQRAGEHLLRIVNDALDLARVEAGKLELQVEDFDLHALVHEVSALMAPVAERRGLQYSDSIVAGLPQWWRGDRTRIAQILMNLLGNAIKFTERGFVSLEVLAASDGARGLKFRIADSGPGLSDEQRRRVFERFEQADGQRTAARYGGSGLGLAISQELASAMGGRIEVESTLGMGAVFVVELPLPTGEPRASGNVQPVRQQDTLSVLLVEDDPTVADVIEGLLRAQGHSVVHVGHGLAALVETDLHPFAVALLDLDLPGIDGFSLAAQLRTNGFAGRLIAITARPDPEAEQLAREAGFDAFLRKPLSGRMLAEVLDQHR